MKRPLLCRLRLHKMRFVNLDDVMAASGRLGTGAIFNMRCERTNCNYQTTNTFRGRRL